MSETMVEEDESLLEQEVNNMRPSYLNFEESRIGPSQADFNSRIARKLSPEFLLEVDDETEKIRTFLRLRPHSSRKTKTDEPSEIYKIESSNILKIDGTKVVRRNNPCASADASRFTFSKILGPECSQSTVFEECVQPILDAFFRGESCLVFSYGATNSGKTYTMQGYGTSFGIVPRTLDHIFNFLEDKLYTYGNIKPNLFNAFIALHDNESQNLEETKQRIMKEVKSKSSEMSSFRDSFIRSSASFSTISNAGDQVININSVPRVCNNDAGHGSVLFAVWVSFAEIYNERVFDLFESVARGKRRKEMKLLTDKQGRVYIKDLTEVCANTAEEAYQLFLAGKANLQFAATHVNNNSSRSHSFFNIRMVSVGVSDRTFYPQKVFQMSFCDLAGIERVSQTQNVGLRLKESGSINQSLFVLLKCIRAMRDKQNKNRLRVEIPPFRESKLARLFQGYLTSATHICMIVNVNPDPEMIESSLQVLQNSAIASEVITYRRVEAPMNDSLFCHKVRQSIGMAKQLKFDLDRSTSSPLKRPHDDSDDEFLGDTVVAKCKNPGTTLSRVAELEAENEHLKKQILEIQDVTRKETAEKFTALLEQQRAYYKSVVQDTENASEMVHDRRISFAAKVIEPLDAGGYLQDMSNAPSADEDDDTASEHSDANIFRTPKNKIINYQLELNKAISNNHKLISDNEDIHEVNRALQCSLDERHSVIAKLQVEIKEKESTFAEQIENLQKMIQLKNEQIEKTNLQDPTKMKEEAFQQVQKLSSELTALNQANASLRNEVTEATNLCVHYDGKLTEANNKIEELTKAYNELHSKNRELTEENELMHLSVDDHMQKLDSSNKEVDQLKVQIVQLKSDLQNESQEKKHKSSRRRLH